MKQLLKTEHIIEGPFLTPSAMWLNKCVGEGVSSTQERSLGKHRVFSLDAGMLSACGFSLEPGFQAQGPQVDKHRC